MADDVIRVGGPPQRVEEDESDGMDDADDHDFDDDKSWMLSGAPVMYVL